MPSSTLNMMYLEIPANLVYKISVKNFGRLVAGGGSYIALGITGRESYAGGNKSENIFSENDGTNPYSSTDFGANFQLGAELNSKTTFRFQQGIGFANISPEAYNVGNPFGMPFVVSKSNIKNLVSSFSVGYLF